MQCRRPWFNSWVLKIHWRRDRLPTPVFLGFPCGSAGKEFACITGDLGSIPGLGEGKGYPLQYSGLKNSMENTVHRVTKSQTQLSNFHFPICSHLQVSFCESLLLELIEMVTPSALPTALSTFNFLQYSLSHLKN